jgi:regulator of protease activity HflC (stomatin/prohibitin superfamily)
MSNATRNTVPPAVDPDGWRQGKPAEDPDKMKRWGLIVAKPSEFLVHVRAGKVLRSSSGQGASCLKLPWDAVAIVPTSLQRLQFRADQVTREKVGVEVVGLAVYRIADPLIAYRVLNFSFPERAQQKLTEALSAMFVGATRRLIANLSVDDCLQKRKQAIAHELLSEVRPVVGGQGSPEDETDRGWGVVIDTIEIQEVRILSQKVFSSMQAPYRASLDKTAAEAQAEATRDVAMRELQYQREKQEAQIAADRAREEAQIAAQVEVENRRIAGERSREEARIAAQVEVENRKIAAEQARREAAAKARMRQIELETMEAEAAVEAHGAELRAAEAHGALERARGLIRQQLGHIEVELLLAKGKAEAEVALAAAEAQVRRAEAEAQVTMAQNLPKLAAALGEKVQVTHVGIDGNVFGSITEALQSVIQIARPALKQGG